MLFEIDHGITGEKYICFVQIVSVEENCSSDNNQSV